MSILDQNTLDFFSLSHEQTERLGRRIGKLLQPGDIIALEGRLGTGKTVLASGIGQGWGAQNALTSPTFTLIHEHRRAGDDALLYHLDCYRLSGSDEVWTLGFDDLIDGENILLIEWPDQIAAALPQELMWVRLRSLEMTRRALTFTAKGERYKDMLDEFRRFTFGV